MKIFELKNLNYVLWFAKAWLLFGIVIASLQVMIDHNTSRWFVITFLIFALITFIGILVEKFRS